MAEFNIYEGLMQKIQALIAPPDFGSKEKNNSEVHPFLKKRGKRHNHDYCDACGEKGNILCCDICPASFHLLCHDPPLIGEHDLSNQWRCRACSSTSEEQEDHDENYDPLENSCSNLDRLKEVDITSDTSDHFHFETSQCSVTNETEEGDVKNEPMEEEDREYEFSDVKKMEDNVADSLSLNCSQERKVPSTELVEIKTEPDCVELYELVESEIRSDEDNSTVISCYQDDNILISRKRRSTMRNNEMFKKRMKYKNVSVQLPKCDPLLKEFHKSEKSGSSVTQFNGTKRKLNRSKEKIRLDHRKYKIRSIKDVFGEIIREAKKMNPKQFTLPSAYLTNINLNAIGSEKGSENVYNDFDSNDLIKLPPRRCYYCNGTCLNGEIVSCDYCSAHFHLNCLNPPLCSIPDVKWMCPLHPHHILNKVMKNPSSITELTTWWNKLSVPINDEAVESEFLNKIKEKKKNNVGKQSRSFTSRIPDIIKYHYKYPTFRIPTLKELTDSENGCVFKGGFLLITHEEIMKSNYCCQSDEMERIEDKNADIYVSPDEIWSKNNYVTKNTCNNKTEGITKPNPYESGTLIEITNDDSKDISNPTANQIHLMKETLSNKDDINNFKFTSYGIYDYDLLSSIPKHRINKVAKKPWKATEQENLNINVTPWQIIKHLILRGIDENFITGDVRMTKLDHALKQCLLSEKLRLVTRDLPPSFLPNTHPYPFFPPASKNGHQIIDKPKAKVRAVLCPLSHRAPLIYMYGHVLSIGSDFSNDVCLLNYGSCNFVSGEHAVIFYDKFSNMYELLNYSEYSTVVDGVWYTCDISSQYISEENDLNILNNSESDDKNNDEQNSISRPVKRSKIKSARSATIDSVRSGREGSAIIAVETRNVYKKLLSDIDKLVTKSQEEMALIADEDLNEINKAIKMNAEVAVHSPELTSVMTQKLLPKKQEPVIVVRKKKLHKRTVASCSTSRDCSFLTTENIKTADQFSSCRSIQNSSVGKSVQVQPRSQHNSSGVRRTNQMKNIVMSPCLHGRYLKKKIARKPFINDQCGENKSRDQFSNDNVKTYFNNEAYESTSSFHTAQNNEKCRCQLGDLKLPIGYDSSWERAAQLHHGSYIRFGCVEFVFSIVNYPVAYENRVYGSSSNTQGMVPKTEKNIIRPSASVQQKEVESLQRKPSRLDSSKDDLSTRLISILNVLSSKTSSVKSSSNSPHSSSDSRGSSKSQQMSSGPSSPDSVTEN